MHELGLFRGRDQLLDLNPSFAAFDREAQVRDELAAGNRNRVVVEIPAHRDELRRDDNVVSPANPSTPFQGRGEATVVEDNRNAEPTGEARGIGERSESTLAGARDGNVDPDRDIGVVVDGERFDRRGDWDPLARTGTEEVVQAREGLVLQSVVPEVPVGANADESRVTQNRKV